MGYSGHVDYTIRRARQDDLSEMYNISRAAHRLDDYHELIPEGAQAEFVRYYRWSKVRRSRYIEKMEALLGDPKSTMLVAAKGGVLLGYTLAVYDGPHHLLLKGLFVRPRYQGQGVGRALFLASYATAPSDTVVLLEVLEANRRAIRLYERQGFVVTGYATTRYFGGQLVQMTKRLS